MLCGFYKPTDSDRQKLLRDKAAGVAHLLLSTPESIPMALDFIENILPHVKNYSRKSKVDEKEKDSNTNNESDPERNRISERLTGFDPKDNIAWKTLTDRLGPNLTHRELLSIARLVSQEANIRLDRDAVRRKIVLIKWFVENWQFVEPRLSDIVLETDMNESHDGFDIIDDDLQLIQ